MSAAASNSPDLCIAKLQHASLAALSRPGDCSDGTETYLVHCGTVFVHLAALQPALDSGATFRHAGCSGPGTVGAKGESTLQL